VAASLAAAAARRTHRVAGRQSGPRFYYGVLRAGERLRIEASEETLRDADVYLTLYSKASFPVALERVVQGCHESERVTGPRMYLVRVHPRMAGEVKGITVSLAADIIA
jgi:hypothetical protein